MRLLVTLPLHFAARRSTILHTIFCSCYFTWILLLGYYFNISIQLLSLYFNISTLTSTTVTLIKLYFTNFQIVIIKYFSVIAVGYPEYSPEIPLRDSLFLGKGWPPKTVGPKILAMTTSYCQRLLRSIQEDSPLT